MLARRTLVFMPMKPKQIFPWKLLENLGVKKMEAPKGGRGGKAVSLCPPSLEKVGGLTYPL